MKNFIDLNETENHEIKKTKLKSQPVIVEEDVGLTLPKLILSEKLIVTKKIDEEEIELVLPKLILSEKLDEEEICVIDGDASDFYGDREKDGCFKLENLFSELVNEYERAIARQNLGIGDAQTLNWGNIKGNILNQADLKDYIFKSPQFVGMPTAPTQSITNSSSAIATTEWVVNYVSQNGGGGGSSNPVGLQSFIVSPNTAMYGSQPVTVELKWEYTEEISSQKINEETLNIAVREKTLILNDSTLITLKYVINDKTYDKKILFTFNYPFYYGTSSDYEQLNKTLSKSFDLNTNDGEYIYLILPVKDAVLSVNGFVGGFELIDEQDLHNVKYYTYRSVNHSLGRLVVNLLN